MSKAVDLPEGMTIHNVPMGRLHPAPWNPRTISDARFRNLVKAIQEDPEFLAVRPVLATADGTIYAGNMRYRAAQELGWETIPAIILDIPEDLAKQRAIRDNNQWGEWESSNLGDLLRELKDSGAILSTLGIDSLTVLRLVRLSALRGGDPDALPEPPSEPIAKPGDLWALGDHRLYCGDATNEAHVSRLLGENRPTMMVTDPPYGVTYDPSWRAQYDGHPRRRTGKVRGDETPSWIAAYRLFPGDVAYVWHAGLFARTVSGELEACGFNVRAQIIWAKNAAPISRGHYHWKHEPLWYAVREGANAHWKGDRKQNTLWEIDALRLGKASEEDAHTNHGTQKPIECMQRPIRNHEGDVYDPFVGSGTSVIAAHREGRRCFAMELDPAYCDITVARWEAFTGETARRLTE